MRRLQPRRRDRSAGFTLVEMIAALAVASVVSLLLLHAIGLTTSVLDRLTKGAERLDEARGVETLLRHTLAAAAAIPAPDGRPIFTGSRTKLSFLSLAEDSGPGVYRIEIALDETRGERPLVFSRRVADPGTEPRIERSVLLRSASGFRLAYFGARSIGEEPAWHDQWSGLAYPPKVVRVIFGSGEGARAPIVVRVWNAG